MKVSEITYTTDRSQFLNYEELESKIEETLVFAITNAKENIVDEVSSYTDTESLGREAFHIDNKPLLQEKAEEFVKNYEDMLENCQKEKNKILENASKHRKAELEKYCQCLQDRISEINQRISSINKQIDNLMQDKEKNISKITQLSDKIQAYNKEKGGFLFSEGLEDKLSWAKKELSKVS